LQSTALISGHAKLVSLENAKAMPAFFVARAPSAEKNHGNGTTTVEPNLDIHASVYAPIQSFAVTALTFRID